MAMVTEKRSLVVSEVSASTFFTFWKKAMTGLSLSGASASGFSFAAADTLWPGVLKLVCEMQHQGKQAFAVPSNWAGWHRPLGGMRSAAESLYAACPAVSRESGAQLPRCASSCSAKQEAARCSLLLLGSTWRLGQVLFHSFAQYSLVGQGKQRENYSTRKVAGPCIPSILVPGWGLLKDFETNFPWDPRTSEFRDLNEI